MNERLVKAFNNQIKEEFFSEYLYLSMYAYFDRMNLPGFRNWMDVQMKEEHAHAMGLFDFVQDRGEKVKLQAISAPEHDWESPVELMEQALEHEKLITSKILELSEIAEEENDKAACILLDWYIKEQVEEEDNVSNLLKTMKLVCNDCTCLYLVDKELAQREFVKPNIG